MNAVVANCARGKEFVFARCREIALTDAHNSAAVFHKARDLNAAPQLERVDVEQMGPQDVRLERAALDTPARYEVFRQVE